MSVDLAAESLPTATPLWQLSASKASALIRSGKITVEDLVRSCLERVAARDPSVRAWSFLDPRAALEQARELDKWPEKGRLHGIPVGVKDVFDTKDMPTQHNSPAYFGHRPLLDAACLMTLRAAGALILGKTETVEFAAAGRQPVTRNPNNLKHTPGGSSSGSAACVADFQVPLSFGTQTGGSVIRAASFCGAFAMKPTWGTVSREGVKMQSLTLDTVGWYARSASDLALLCDLYAIDDDEPTCSFSLRGARIAVCKSSVWKFAEPATRNALERGGELLRAAGAEIVDLELPGSFDALPDGQVTIQNSEGRASFLSEYRTHPSSLHPVLRSRVENQEGITRSDLRQAYNVAAQCRALFDELCGNFDAVLTPSAPGEAPEGFESTGWDIFNRTWSMLHAPCVNVPGFSGPRGLPIGLTLTGARFTDRKVLAVAGQVADCFEREVPPRSVPSN